ncbi:MAG: hypothetical protein NC489_08860 [Ruminococcus flavefaciens]|nr:hypothetical protein [Ruminococcus flavefaciens]
MVTMMLKLNAVKVIDLDVMGELVAITETSQGTLGLVSYAENGREVGKYFLLPEAYPDGVYEIYSFNLVGELCCDDINQLEVSTIMESVEMMANTLEEDRG